MRAGPPYMAALARPPRGTYSVGDTAPAAYWDFDTMEFGGAISLTRASDAIGFDAGGRFAQVGPNQIRLDRRGALKAALFEEQSANLFTHSRAELGPNWSLSTAVGSQLALDALGEFPGVSVASTGAAWHRLAHSQRPQLAANTPYTISVWVMQGTSARMRVALRASAQAIESNIYFAFTGNAPKPKSDWGVITNASLTAVGPSGLHLATLTFTPNLDGQLNFGVGPGTSTAGETVVVLGVQLEQGVTASSYIRTDGAAQQRDTDVVSWGAPSGVWDLRVVDGRGQSQDVSGVTVGNGWVPRDLPFAPARVLLYPAGTL